MAEYTAKQCDQCGKVHQPEESTRYTQRFEGPNIDHERTIDLCLECLEKFGMDLDEGMRPIRRRGAKKTQDTPSETVPMEPAKQ